MFANNIMENWVQNRLGNAVNTKEIEEYFGDDAHEKGISEEDARGIRDFEGYVGYVKIDRYGKRASAGSADRISDKLCPFIQQIINILIFNDALVDINRCDKIMFIVPRVEIGSPMQINLINILKNVPNVILRNSDFKVRVGLSSGFLFLNSIRVEDRRKWFVTGDPIKVANRILKNDLLKEPCRAMVAICNHRTEQTLQEMHLIRSELEHTDYTKTLSFDDVQIAFIKNIGDMYLKKIIVAK
ncbi:MAG: hypothetical protein M0P13_07595 [Fibrobacteraceae bacterium]|nr:hypothetical protein [Fibrobacteraceae bacterium]